MKFIKGFTFLMGYSETQAFAGEEMKQSLKTMLDVTGSDTAVLAFGALMKTPHSEEINWKGKKFLTDDELREMIRYAQSLGVRVILKPMVNCQDGTWRAYINFFDVEVPCEAKWSIWFKNYTEYMLHYAEIAEEMNCEMLIIGCELVMTERKEEYWQYLIAKIRQVYHGLLTYNTDKYQEEHVKWWDALDVISSSGYYPMKAWNENLERIRKVVDAYEKPFFFAECGSPCRTGCSAIPNDWTFVGPLDYEEQRKYYEVMFETCKEYPFVSGFVPWAWSSNYTEYPIENDGYSVYQKPSCDVIKNFYSIQFDL